MFKVKITLAILVEYAKGSVYLERQIEMPFAPYPRLRIDEIEIETVFWFSECGEFECSAESIWVKSYAEATQRASRIAREDERRDRWRVIETNPPIDN